ncbi:antitoxin VbhA family protein [Tsukamurella paurometabola]|uniref:Antitoxin VbhA family protein n=1 Tax=Tsukamurella paurometabola TaxID=2061 RepID=A0ABS5NEU0_TSUPA|nr:antitoxin VbhA family protein [Tsukamurella paurometabola]MBS4102786.1 antitoxin VbhA family protein [Tsukamurella paurometabola]
MTTPGERRERAERLMPEMAVDGYMPSTRVLADVQDYIDGKPTTEIIQEIKARYGVVD